MRGKNREKTGGFWAKLNFWVSGIESRDFLGGFWDLSPNFFYLLPEDPKIPRIPGWGWSVRGRGKSGNFWGIPVGKKTLKKFQFFLHCKFPIFLKFIWIQTLEFSWIFP